MVSICILKVNVNRIKSHAYEKTIRIIFELKGNIYDIEKAKPACGLSIDKYCSVAATLRAAGATIKWEVRVIN